MSKRKLDEQPDISESPVDKKARMTSTESDSESKPATDGEFKATSTQSDPKSKPAKDNEPASTSIEPAKQARTKPKPPTFLTLPCELRQQIIYQYLIPDEDEYEDWESTEDFVEYFIELDIGETVNEHHEDVFYMAQDEYCNPMDDLAKALGEAYPEREAEIERPMKEARRNFGLDYGVTLEIIKRWVEETFEEWYEQNYLRRDSDEEEEEEEEEDNESEEDDAEGEEDDED